MSSQAPERKGTEFPRPATEPRKGAARDALIAAFATILATVAAAYGVPVDEDTAQVALTKFAAAAGTLGGLFVGGVTFFRKWRAEKRHRED